MRMNELPQMAASSTSARIWLAVGVELVDVIVLVNRTSAQGLSGRL